MDRSKRPLQLRFVCKRAMCSQPDRQKRHGNPSTNLLGGYLRSRNGIFQALRIGCRLNATVLAHRNVFKNIGIRWSSAAAGQLPRQEASARLCRSRWHPMIWFVAQGLPSLAWHAALERHSDRHEPKPSSGCQPVIRTVRLSFPADIQHRFLDSRRNG